MRALEPSIESGIVVNDNRMTHTCIQEEPILNKADRSVRQFMSVLCVQHDAYLRRGEQKLFGNARKRVPEGIHRAPSTQRGRKR